ncbi:MAG: YigZ family protein [Firmicutes bacterium]|nr:YigZ family protein [Bacillota bacterium]
MELYKTIKKDATAEQIIEKSRFIAHARPVSDRDEADAFIAEIKAKYKDATHNVPAMVIGDKSQIQWASDDGEPQGTSGAPIVQMLVSEGITNLVIVVTRYFGGIKLGTGGLVRAYTSSAKLAVEAAGVCSVQNMLRMTCETDYTYLAKFQKMAVESLKDQTAFAYVIGNVEYGEKVTLELISFAENEEELRGLAANLTSGSARITTCSAAPEKTP